ncbi:DNA-directed RNA polymerase subunit omega [Parathermosynechococcus lividus]|jgi:DNA-directed RNA polymerase subunit omega|nr:DNA-directed RNA polymerase subunit omega [Synechococcus sp. PCC 6716]
MQKRLNYSASDIMRRAEQLIQHSSNRYRITVQIANRAKQRRGLDASEDFDDLPLKPVTRAIIEMSDEIAQPELLAD